MTSTKPLVRSGGTISPGQQGEKRPWWRCERCCLLLSRRTRAGGKVAVVMATPLISTIPCRFWQTCQALWAIGIERIDPFLLVFLEGRTDLRYIGSERETGSKSWASGREQTWSVTSFLLFPLCDQRDIAGGKLWELSLPTGRRASPMPRWLTEKPQLRDLWCSLSVHISLTQSATRTQFLHHPSDYFQ